ncbi:MAG: Na/Pi cotransporter family protein [Clostridia bacterium]|nr:Na/Pi cotransporter family protein [Clostridia bacterium]
MTILLQTLQLICGLALFLYGMNVMGDAMKRIGGSRMKSILSNATSNPRKGFLLGLGVTALVQSSSATTVMIVGFVNSGLMTLRQTVGVIMGANVGSASTAWLTGLSVIEGGDSGVLGYLNLLKPTSWMPLLAITGLFITMMSKNDRKKNIGHALLGFSVLMVGMEYMAHAVEPLKESAGFRSLLTMFENPGLGIIAGLIPTLVVQSSAASIGILQVLATTGEITYGTSIPIIMGLNIGTCVTAMLSSIGANKNARRTALIHLYFNVLSALVWLIVFLVVSNVFDIPFLAHPVDHWWGIAAVHTAFKILSVISLAPFSRLIERLAVLSVPENKGEDSIDLLDERLFLTPTVAVERATEVTEKMAVISCEAFRLSLGLIGRYDEKIAGTIRDFENKADLYEDSLGSYLTKLASTRDLPERESKQVTTLLHLIGDFERISDHAVNLVESAEEIRDKKVVFSNEANRELSVMYGAVDEILTLAADSFTKQDLHAASLVEPLEQVVDYLRDEIKLQHILRLQKSECSIEHGFVLADILTNLERVSDHCSNIAGLILEMSANGDLGMHQYLRNVRAGGESFKWNYKEYLKKYSLGVGTPPEVLDK